MHNTNLRRAILGAQQAQLEAAKRHRAEVEKMMASPAWRAALEHAKQVQSALAQVERAGIFRAARGATAPLRASGFVAAMQAVGKPPTPEQAKQLARHHAFQAAMRQITSGEATTRQQQQPGQLKYLQIPRGTVRGQG